MLPLWEMFPLRFCSLLAIGDTNDTDGRGGGTSAPQPFLSPEVTITEQSRTDPKAFCEYVQNESKDIDANRH